MRVLFLILIMAIEFTAWSADRKSCDDVLLLTNPISMKRALEELKVAIDATPGGTGASDRAWYRLLSDYSRMTEAEDGLLVASIVGGGNAGKSSLFNSLSAIIANRPGHLLDQPLSVAGFFPGLTKRMVVAVGPNQPPKVTSELRHRFGQLDPWTSVDVSGTAGPGLLAERSDIPEGLAFVDSPDFDTGTTANYEPTNLKVALRVIYPSDVLTVLVDSRTIRNQANVKLLSSAFKLYGKKSLILVFLADAAISQDEIRDLLIELANSLFDIKGENFPDGVLGAYIMPYSSEVAAKRSLVQLQPLAGFSEFSELAKLMANQSAAIKRFSQTSAINTVINGTEEYLRTHYKRAYAVRIHQQAMKAAARVASLQLIGDFQYLEVRDVLRNRYRSFDGQLRSLIYQFGNVTAIPDRLLLNLIQHYRPRAILAKQLAKDHRAHDRVAVTQLLSILHNERLPIPSEPSEDIKALENSARDFFEMFPEEAREEHAGQITLPPTRLLPESIRREYEKLTSGDTEQWIERLSSLIDSVEMDPHESLSRHDLNYVLGKVRRNQSIFRTGTISLLDLATLAAPAGSVYWLTEHGINNTLIWLAVIIGSSRPLRWWSDNLVDGHLQREINAWYHKMQFDSTHKFFTETMAGPLLASIAREIAIYDGPEFQRLARALKDVKASMDSPPERSP